MPKKFYEIDPRSEVTDKNTPAYRGTELFTTVKIFIIQATGSFFTFHFKLSI
jgi:hypothetical protein